MSSIAPTSSSGILSDLFLPLPQDNATQEKHLFDHIADYVGTTEGARDLFRLAAQVMAWIHKYLRGESSPFVNNVSQVVETAEASLSIPLLIADSVGLRNSVTALVNSRELPYSDPLRSQKIAQAAKKSVIDTLGVVNDATQVISFADRVGVLPLQAAHMAKVSGVNHVTSILIDGTELIGEGVKLKHYISSESRPQAPAEANKLSQKKILSWMVIAKDVGSIGGSAIAIVGIIFGIAIHSIPIVMTASLLCGTLWLTMKITSHFYNKIVVEAPPVTLPPAIGAPL